MAKGAEGRDKSDRNPVLVDFALQGGGSHGAFTWGVLDRLLEEPWLKVEAISGTSAGAMNAAVLVSGWMKGGAEGARVALDAYWKRVAEAAKFSPLQRSPIDRLMNRWTLDTSPAYLAMDLMTRVVSPYDLNSIRSGRSCPRASTSPISPRRRSSSSSPRPTCIPAVGASSATPKSRPRSFSPPPACPPCSRRSRSTASRTGTEASPGTRQ